MVDDKKQISDLEKAIIKTLLYAGVFRYPLTDDEVIRYCEVKIIDKNEFYRCVDNLLQQQLIYRIDSFLLPINDATYVEKRIVANKNAERHLPIAQKFARLLYRFPYVRAVCLSGSISKKNFYEGSDIDFFIIAQTKRLWFVWTIIQLYLRIFMPKRRKFFCTNYLIDTKTEVQPQNIYTSYELITLMFSAGKKDCIDFMLLNNWALQYFPNINLEQLHFPDNQNTSKFKKRIEFLCNNKLIDFIDKQLMRFLSAQLIHKFKKRNGIIPDKERVMQTINAQVIKMYFFTNHQPLILNNYDASIRSFETTNNIKLS